jgi:hypothetical protein
MCHDLARQAGRPSHGKNAAACLKQLVVHPSIAYTDLDNLRLLALTCYRAEVVDGAGLARQKAASRTYFESQRCS